MDIKFMSEVRVTEGFYIGGVGSVTEFREILNHEVEYYVVGTVLQGRVHVGFSAYINRNYLEIA